jgi:hypothetical protein
MKPALFAAFAAIVAAPAFGQMVDDYCNDYWFVRNQIFDKAGYCFSSPLGRASFDNSDCTGKDVRLSAADQALVARIKDIETRGGCHVDTSRTSLPIPLIWLRLQLTDLAARDEYSGYGCFGYKGPGVMLWAGHSESGVPISEVRPGDDLTYLYDTTTAPPGWTYVEVERDGVPVGLGWIHQPIPSGLCSSEAG